MHRNRYHRHGDLAGTLLLLIAAALAAIAIASNLPEIRSIFDLT